MGMSEPATTSIDAGLMRARAAFIAASSIRPRPTWRAMLYSICLRPEAIRSLSTSFRNTS